MPVLLVTEDFEDASLAFSVTGSWTRVNTTAGDGSWSYKAPATSDNGTSDAVVTLPAGATGVRFKWRVSSEATWDFLRFLVGSNVVFEVSGELGWAQTPIIPVTPGSTITFRYVKDSGSIGGSDTAWIDTVEFFADTPTVLTTMSSGPSSTSQTISWSGVIPGRRLVVAVNTHVAVNSFSGGWVRDAGDSSRGIYSKIAASGDTSLALTLASADTRVMATAYQMPPWALLTEGANGSNSPSSLIVTETIPAALEGWVFGLCKAGNPLNAAVYSHDLRRDFTASGTQNYADFTSVPLPGPGSAEFQVSSLTTSGGFHTQWVVASYGLMPPTPRRPLNPGLSVAGRRASLW
ncbi:hypothetical protein [Herbidospora mongoliensis]|uniref:hypothetical protein n=1 Tax=Herbidospora mongoliensis TaxID=688067 RepID=UPI000833BEDB|nr:hypothetical protein [Herbidospora mongoliensis]